MMISKLYDSIQSALLSASCYSNNVFLPDGYWWGECITNVTPTAEYVLLHQAFGLDIEPGKDAICKYLLSEQRADGSWATAFGNPGNVTCTVEAYLALKILGIPADSEAMCRARDFAISHGGIASTSMFTRVVLAGFGLIPWSSLPHLPPEISFLPSWLPFSLYTTAAWGRLTVFAFAICRHHKCVRPLPNGLSSNNDFLDELWRNPADKDVPYCAPLWKAWRISINALLLTTIHLVLSFVDILCLPFRRFSRRASVRWILSAQEPAGDWMSYVPTQYMVMLALQDEGFKIEDDSLARGLNAMKRLLWEDKKGKRLQVCPSPTWDTALMIIGMCNAGQPTDHPHLKSAVSWLNAHQCLDVDAAWRIPRPDLPAGGFAWSPWALKTPDVDDTVTVVMAFLKQDPKSLASPNVRNAIEWFMGMQNKNGGYSAFESNNNPAFINKLEFDRKAMFDPACEDITGHALELFAMILQSPYQNDLDPDLINRIKSASVLAIKYLASTQHKVIGGWFGRWGVNYIYGTSGVLCGLEHFVSSVDLLSTVSDNKHDDWDVTTMLLSKFQSREPDMVQMARRLVPPALAFLRRSQNTDGGWGEGYDSYSQWERAGIGASTASQTSWAVMGLLAHLPPNDDCIQKGIKYLLDNQVEMKEGGKSWVEQSYTGAGFVGSYDLRYDYYRHYFPMMALGRYAKAIGTLED